MSDSTGESEGSTIFEQLRKRLLLRELVEYAAKNLPGDLTQYSGVAIKNTNWYLFNGFTLWYFSSNRMYALTHDRETGEIIDDTRAVDPNDDYGAKLKTKAVSLQEIYRDELPKDEKDLEEDENQETN